MNLFKHQSEDVEFVMNHTPDKGIGGFGWEMGLGKTRGTLHLYHRIQQHIPRIRLLVIAPLSLLEGAWGADIQRWSNYTYHNMHRDGRPNLEYDRHGRARFLHIVVVNYEAVLSEKTQAWIEEMAKTDTWLCALDESSRLKNHTSKTAKYLLKAAPLFRFRLIMSGTMAPNSELEYWPQMQFIQPGLLHPSFYGFRNKFFYLRNRYTGAEFPQGAKLTRSMMQEVLRRCDYAITADKRQELMSEVCKWIRFRKKKDCLDLPETIDEIRKVQLSKEQRMAYEEMRRNLIIEIKDETIIAPVALTKVMKLRQITSGFVYNTLGEAFEVLQSRGEKASPLGPTEVKEFRNPKIEELMDVIEEAGDQQAIIWIQFHWELIKICHELFKKYGQGSVVTLSSSTKDRDESIQAFKAGKSRFLVAHPKSAAHGLTFTNCNLQIFFSLDYSWEAYIQAKARTDRAGQTKSTTYVHLIAEDTIDEQILETIQKKGAAQKIVFDILKGKATEPMKRAS